MLDHEQLVLPPAAGLETAHLLFFTERSDQI